MMFRRFALAVICAATIGCRGEIRQQAGAAVEAPPPPIESDLPPESRLIEPRADALMRAMSERLAQTDALAFEAEEVYDEVPEHSPRQQLTSRRAVALRRPNRLAGDANGDAIHRSFYYDGRTLSVIDKEQNVWASGTVPPTIDDAIDWVFDKTGTVIPLADFLYADVYARLMGSVQRGVYLGIHDVNGVPCHHLSFEQATIDWQIWIDAGAEPVPRKLLIAYKTEDEVPQYTVTIRKWNLHARVPDQIFRFEAPPGSSRVEIAALAPPMNLPVAPTATPVTKR